MAAKPHTIVVLQSWGGQKFPKVFWCPVLLTYRFEADGYVTHLRNDVLVKGCIGCGKKVKRG